MFHFFLQMCQLRPGPHYIRRIWKLRFYSINVSFSKLSIIIAFFYLCLSKIRVRKCRDYRNNVVSWKASFSTCSLSTLKRKADVVKFLWFEENRFRKAPFSWRSSVDSWSVRGNDAANSNFSGILWTDLKLRAMPLIVYYLISGA